MRKRLPEARQVRLNQRRIFILPTQSGVGLVVILVLMLIAAINFQNSLIYAVCFWLGALWVITILHTYRNLSGLTLRYIQSFPCFAGQSAVFEIAVQRPEGRPRLGIFLGWKKHDLLQLDLDTEHSERVRLSHPTQQRGRFIPPRLNIYTRYPTGLMVAWSYLYLDLSAIVYPTPLGREVALHSGVSGDLSEDGLAIPHGVSDFGGMRDYQAGDAIRQIHWAKYAQTGKLYTKAFVDYQHHDLWLDWDTLTLNGTENRLSHLCQRVLAFHQQQRRYGLKIPGIRIEPGQGDGHRTACLTALALFGEEHD